MSRRLRADIVVNNLVGHAVTTGKVLLQSDGIAVAPARPHPTTSSAAVACLAAPREAIHDEAFNVGKVGENYRIREVAEIVKDVVPDCEIAFARRRLTGHAELPGRLLEDRPARARVRARVDGASRRRAALRGVLRGAGSTEADWTGWRYYRLPTIQHLQDDGVIDENLRRIG